MCSHRAATNITTKCHSEIPQRHSHVVESFPLALVEDYVQPEIFGWCDLPGLVPASSQDCKKCVQEHGVSCPESFLGLQLHPSRQPVKICGIMDELTSAAALRRQWWIHQLN